MEIQGKMRGSLRDFLYVVFKRKIQILFIFVASVFVVSAATFMMKPSYEATSRLLVKIGRENLYVPPSGNMTPVININREEQIKSEIEILKSPSLAGKVVETLGPATIYKGLLNGDRGPLKRFVSSAQARETAADKALLSLQKSLKVAGVRKSNVIEVSFGHEDPKIAAAVVNELVRLYMDHHLEVYKNSGSYTFFREQTKILKQKLKKAEERLKNFKKQNGFTSLREEQSLLLRQEADLKTAFNQTFSQKAETESRIVQIKKQLAATPETVPQGEEIDHNPFLISTLEAKLVELQINEKKLLTKYTEQSRLVQNVRKEISLLKEKLAEQELKRYGKSRSGLNLTYQRLQEELLRNEADLKALKAKLKTQKAQLGEYSGRLQKLNKIEMDLNLLQNQVDVDRQNYRLYLTRFEESRISNAMDTEKIANVSLIEPARPPIKPVKPKVVLNLFLGLLLGVFGSVAIAFLREYLDDSLEKPEDVEEILELSVLASIPELKK